MIPIINNKQQYAKANPLTKIKLAFLLMLFLFANIFVNQSLAQNYDDLEKYSIAKSADGFVHLFFGAPSALLTEIGNTNRTDIQSLSIHPINNTIYAVSNGELGMLDKTNGSFNSIGVIGNGTGDSGNMVFNNIYGLAHSYNEEALYATHRVKTAEDMLIKINTVTGKLIKNSFVNTSGNSVDYTSIESVKHSNPNGNGDCRFVTDISINPFNHAINVIQTDNVNTSAITTT